MRSTILEKNKKSEKNNRKPQPYLSAMKFRVLMMLMLTMRMTVAATITILLKTKRQKCV